MLWMQSVTYMIRDYSFEIFEKSHEISSSCYLGLIQPGWDRMYTGDQYLINAYCPSSAWIQYQLKALSEQHPTITNRTNFINFHVDKIIGSLNQIQCAFDISSLFLKELLKYSRIWYFQNHYCYLNQWKHQFKNYDIIVTIKISNHGWYLWIYFRNHCFDVCLSIDRHFISWLKS